VPRRSVVLLVALAAACSGGSGATGGAQGPGGSARLSERQLSDRPALMLVERAGDPSGAVAFAVSHGAGSLASVAAAHLLVARLAARGVPGVGARPHALGFTLSTFVRGADDAKRFVAALAAVLTEPPRAGEAGLKAARAAVDQVQKKPLLAAQAALSSCSGELTPSAAGFDPERPASLALLGAVLATARGRTETALAAVGPRTVLEGLERALADGPTWPATAPSDDPWPARDELGVDFASATSRRLSVAVRTSTADAAIGAAEDLGAPGTLLALRLGALRPGWNIERALGTARPRGGCLRVDAVPPPGDPGPVASEVARALAVVEEELGRALARPTRHALEEAVLRPADPREAASAAAWSTLSHPAAAAAPRRTAAYTTLGTDKGTFDLPQAVAAFKDAASRTFLERRSRNEAGQARALALLGTACGTATESATDAGETALLVSALAKATARGGAEGVTFLPVITAGGVGLLADAPRRDVHEHPAEQAARLGRALGERVTVVQPAEHDVTTARDELIRSLGSGKRAAYFAALDAATRGHPSWLEPRGTLEALGSAPSGGFHAALARFLARPLRIAVLSNGSATDAGIVAAEVERFVRPVRGTPTRCPTRATPPHEPRELTLLAGDDQTPGATLAFPFAPFLGRPPREARAAVFLLNRPLGWLEQSLGELSASATVRALGGPQTAALTVEIAAASGSERTAVERIQALFDRLAVPGAVSARDFALAQKELEQSEAEERVDPRLRAVELFLGAEAPGPLDPVRLSQFLASLERQSAVLVNVAPRRAP
jgi:hypothetical protein